MATLIKYGTPVMLLALLIVGIVNTILIRFLFKAVDGIKESIVWREEYGTKIVDIERRIERLEKLSNGRT